MDVSRRRHVLAVLSIWTFLVLTLAPTQGKAIAVFNCMSEFASLIRVKLSSLVLKSNELYEICDYRRGHCYENVISVVKAMQKQGVNTDDVKVLYVTDIEGYWVHAIVEHDGKIFDALRFDRRRETVRIRGIPIHQYFARASPEANSQVLRIPAAHYLETFEQNGHLHFLRQTDRSLPPDAENERLSLRGYLRRLWKKPSTN